MRESRTERLIRRNRCIDCAVRHSRRDRRATYRSQQTTLKCSDVGWVGSNQVGNASRQDVAEDAEAGPKNRIRFELPGDGRSAVAELPMA